MTGFAGKEKLSLCLGDLSMCSPKIWAGGGSQERSVVSWEEHSAMLELKRISAPALSAKPGMGKAGWSHSVWGTQGDVKGVANLSSLFYICSLKWSVKQRCAHSHAQGCGAPLTSPWTQPMVGAALGVLLTLWHRLSGLRPWRSHFLEEFHAEAVFSLGSHNSQG